MKRDKAELSELMTRNEVCRALNMSRDTFRRHLLDGPPTGTEGDVRDIQQHKRGSKTLWVRSSVEAFING